MSHHTLLCPLGVRPSDVRLQGVFNFSATCAHSSECVTCSNTSLVLTGTACLGKLFNRTGYTNWIFNMYNHMFTEDKGH